ncbi:hypothetical protein RRG08_018791 [Elysia crispata]|uniref:Peptidase S1 domain-containing protein n=1 Tax=Elysia crispata TaxID=231223 RepID=A0AAE0YIE0_9GAST|nr:hypothetical protein RRG08_018791 [Elysia crispata]
MALIGIENCGVKSSNWIVGGQEASPGRWAWQVSLQEYNVTSRSLSSAYSVTAVLGSYNLSITDPGEQRIKADKLIGHPDYRHGGNYPDDVGLVHLATPVTMSRSISTVCLPQQEASVEDRSKTLHGPNARCWETGCCRTLGVTDAHVLNEAEVDLIDREKCATSWTGYITFSHICAAGSSGAAACEGDSGGPLNCVHAGRYYLEGMISWGEDSCRLSGYPSVFTRVALYTNWIRNTVTSASSFL